MLKVVSSLLGYMTVSLKDMVIRAQCCGNVSDVWIVEFGYGLFECGRQSLVVFEARISSVVYPRDDFVYEFGDFAC